MVVLLAARRYLFEPFLAVLLALEDSSGYVGPSPPLKGRRKHRREDRV
jgi:hypothetical protein